MNLWGVNIDEITRKEALARLEKPQVIFTPNPEILLEARRNTDFRHALSKGTLMLPDGHGLQLVSALMKIPSRVLRVLLYFPGLFLFLVWKQPFRSVFPELIHGSDFMEEVIHWAAEREFSVFFLGGEEDVALRTSEHFKKKYPRLRVAGASSQDPGEEAMEEVSRARAQILFVAYGAPKQELWIAEHAGKIPSLKQVMSVGGSFDFYSGKVRRAPRAFRTLGLEWLWRLYLNPVKRMKRIWNAVVVFPFSVLFELDRGAK